MKSLNQLLLDFDYEQNFKDDDFYVGKSNFYAFEMINKWPKWEKNFLNINGKKFSGKTHLVNIFLKKFNGIRIDVNSLNDFDIFYAPSGSDLCYFPIMFSRIINPDKKIFSVVTCPEELGTGSNTAIKGEYFLEPINLKKMFLKMTLFIRILLLTNRPFLQETTKEIF